MCERPGFASCAFSRRRDCFVHSRDAVPALICFCYAVMELTKKFVKHKNPCVDGFRWFLRHHQEGSDYQPLLDALVAAGRVDDACWLLTQFGPTESVLTVDAIEAEAMVFAGTLVVQGNIDVGSVLRAGRSIKAGGGVRAGHSIIAGENIQIAGSIRSEGMVDARGDIKAGWGIEVQGNMRCGGDLRADWDLLCGGDLFVAGHVFARADLKVEGLLRCEKTIRAGGAIDGRDRIWVGNGIESGATITCEGHLEAGWGIKAKEAIVCNGAIKAGESVQAVGEIQAGNGYGIYAGLNVHFDAWEASGQVHARSKPECLMSGWWGGACVA